MYKLTEVMQLLINKKKLPGILKDYALQGNWKACCDLHKEPDWLLIDSVNDKHVHCDRTGTRSDLFK
ncbi:type II toxin-antitoxin system mRNA interferase toxin, RelE/StbE family [Bartonella koehlerae]|uniref:RelE/StbE family addiction module toxin n=1 Tax=Bartonella koehlerae C-29 TaxID=1134510 RepID=A0A067WIF4_9HYPH|nr:type II toxin-antitoxin system mRNA interferase toxin, RelE/StbE family [Bartonella koehlerae]KEC56548.1 RelE/StbE family addiction module toxin [Bartonella koehlerae C-29]